MLVMENKLKDGKEQTVLVNAATLNGPTVVPHQDPTQLRNQLIHQMMKSELGDIISTCKEIGNTDGKGGSQKDTSSPTDATSTSNAVASTVVDAKKAQNEAVQQAEQATTQAQQLGKTQDPSNVKATDPSTKTQVNQKAEDQAAERAKEEKQQKMHDLIWNHNVFWALLQVAMTGDSSIFNVLSEALGKNADLLQSNQEASGIVTKINDDLQQIAAGTAGPETIKDLQLETEKLQYLGGSGHMPPGLSPSEQQKLEQTKKDIGPDLQKECGELGTEINDEANNNGGGFAAIIASFNQKGQPAYNKFRGDMINQSGTKPTSSGPTGIYTKTSTLLTSLNTAGSQYMAQQNLDTKQIDQVEKLWTSGMSTEKAANQTVVGNIAN